jgi:hypothetical protein
LQVVLILPTGESANSIPLSSVSLKILLNEFLEI